MDLVARHPGGSMDLALLVLLTSSCLWPYGPRHPGDPLNLIILVALQTSSSLWSCGPRQLCGPKTSSYLSYGPRHPLWACRPLSSLWPYGPRHPGGATILVAPRSSSSWTSHPRVILVVPWTSPALSYGLRRPCLIDLVDLVILEALPPASGSEARTGCPQGHQDDEMREVH
jgi:hypothetical protein